MMIDFGIISITKVQPQPRMGGGDSSSSDDGQQQST